MSTVDRGSTINTIRRSPCRIALWVWHHQRAVLENVELAGIKQLLLPVKGENSQRCANPRRTHTHIHMQTPNNTPHPAEVVFKLF